MDRAAADLQSLLGDIKRNGFAVIADRSFAGGVCGCARNVDQARALGHVDDRSAAFRVHGLERVSTPNKHTIGVDRMPVIERAILRIARTGAALKAGYPGIIEQNIDLWISISQPIPLRFVAHVDCKEFTADLCGSSFAFFFIDISQDHARTLARKCVKGATANTARSAGDYTDFVFEFCHAVWARQFTLRCRCPDLKACDRVSSGQCPSGVRLRSCDRDNGRLPNG